MGHLNDQILKFIDIYNDLKNLGVRIKCKKVMEIARIKGFEISDEGLALPTSQIFNAFLKSNSAFKNIKERSKPNYKQLEL